MISFEEGSNFDDETERLKTWKIRKQKRHDKNQKNNNLRKWTR